MILGLCHIVVIVIALLADVDTLSTGVLAEVGAKSSHLTHSIISETNVIRERLLRTNRRDEADEGVNDINEER
ncbi:RxLR effector protein, partial [Phytophthora megakarya]